MAVKESYGKESMPLPQRSTEAEEDAARNWAPCFAWFRRDGWGR